MIATRFRRAFVLSSLLWACAAPQAAERTLEVDVNPATAGFFQLRWDGDEPVVLVESTDEDFTEARILYEGADTARVQSGLPDAVYYYRLEDPATGAVISNVREVEVRHHPLGRAFLFFGIGATVFLATIGLIAFGARRELG